MPNTKRPDILKHIVHRIDNGIGIINPNTPSKSISSPAVTSTGAEIGDLMQLPLSFWMLDKSCATIAINKEGVKVCGFSSEDDAFGNTLSHVSTQESAHTLLNNCAEVIQTQSSKMFEEQHQRKDNSTYQFLSFKIPWYNLSHELIGVCGFSIALGHHALASNLETIRNIGILNTEPNKNHTETCNLSPRQHQCLKLLKQGFTAKMIAKELALSYRTIESYIEHLKNKFGASSKFELIQKTMHYRI